MAIFQAANTTTGRRRSGGIPPDEVLERHRVNCTGPRRPQAASRPSVCSPRLIFRPAPGAALDDASRASATIAAPVSCLLTLRRWCCQGGDHGPVGLACLCYRGPDRCCGAEDAVPCPHCASTATTARPPPTSLDQRTVRCRCAGREVQPLGGIRRSVIAMEWASDREDAGPPGAGRESRWTSRLAHGRFFGRDGGDQAPAQPRRGRRGVQGEGHERRGGAERHYLVTAQRAVGQVRDEGARLILVERVESMGRRVALRVEATAASVAQRLTMAILPRGRLLRPAATKRSGMASGAAIARPGRLPWATRRARGRISAQPGRRRPAPRAASAAPCARAP